MSAVDGAVGLGDGAAAVEAARLVQHHLSGHAFSNLWTWRR